MAISLKQNLNLADEKMLAASQHVLIVLPPKKMEKIPFIDALNAKLKRTHKKYEDLSKCPLSVDLPNGAVAALS